ncbi:MAG TPA: phosphotransferase [Vicinamibacterales bacterium]|nr:phosphotransferase [Vicinamibacterales bacterium]
MVLAYDAAQRLLLTAQVEGEVIIALHRRLARRFGFDAREIMDAWRGVGAWLSTLHRSTLTPVVSAARADELREYTEDRFLRWAQVDPRQQRLAHAAIDVLKAITARCGCVRLTLVPCHGDVSAYNILVSETVGLIDFDDARFDLPALDLSQAVLELRNVSRLFWTVPLKGVIQSAEAALLAGCGGNPPDGAEFWLPHFRNLSVYLLTLARRRSGATLSRVTDELRYQGILSELRRAIRAVRQSGENASYWRQSF